MPWLRDKLVFRQKSGCYGEVGYHGTHGHQNYCLDIWAMEGLTEKQVKSVFGQFMTVTLHGRGKKFTQVFL